ncbi:polysaccharide biosynthesis/export family protein [Wenyingzhuangia aestuarii]|uniref:polysaccharide biosynthesis/export family protein n=1 Tax=Wenyingzhuangia aestuarii TaxID=1647582 RepID=UPI001439DECE|nr:polysaccharide biosynthesis/export family protein [Wenyingzhuangia aestuarii]NJB83329.1 polysaccharide export outer membrane protein [Wenyingzhuangia aestuarii]
MKNIVIAFITLILFTSCVSNKRTTYLQGSLLEKKYDFPHKTFKTQINDILLITVSSKDKELTDFFNSLGSSNSSQGNASNINPYFSGYRIDIHGNIRLPYIGEMNVLGFTLNEIRTKIENELAKYLQNTDTYFVTVKNAGIKYTIVGEIGAPGTNTLQSYEATIIDAIASSGDITEYGNRTNIEVIRQEENGVKKHIIDLTNIESLNSDVFLLKNNDIINIKPIRQKPVGIGTTGLSVFNTVLSTFTVAITTILFINSL